jgi:hypothetical protein
MWFVGMMVGKARVQAEVFDPPLAINYRCFFSKVKRRSKKKCEKTDQTAAMD